MNRKNAIQSGNWSDPQVWGGVLPDASTAVFCNGFSIYVDQDIYVKSISNEQTYTDVVGGGIIIKENCFLRANLYCTNNPLISFNLNKLRIKGNVVGSNLTGFTPCISNDSTGTIEIDGIIKGGSAGYCPGIINRSSGFINVTGSVCNGLGGWSYGIYNESSGKVIINNNEITEKYIGVACPDEGMIYI